MTQIAMPQNELSLDTIATDENTALSELLEGRVLKTLDHGSLSARLVLGRDNRRKLVVTSSSSHAFVIPEDFFAASC